MGPQQQDVFNHALMMQVWVMELTAKTRPLPWASAMVRLLDPFDGVVPARCSFWSIFFTGPLPLEVVFFSLGCDSIEGGVHKHVNWACRISLPLFGTWVWLNAVSFQPVVLVPLSDFMFSPGSDVLPPLLTWSNGRDAVLGSHAFSGESAIPQWSPSLLGMRPTNFRWKRWVRPKNNQPQEGLEYLVGFFDGDGCVDNEDARWANSTEDYSECGLHEGPSAFPGVPWWRNLPLNAKRTGTQKSLLVLACYRSQHATCSSIVGTSAINEAGPTSHRSQNDCEDTACRVFRTTGADEAEWVLSKEIEVHMGLFCRLLWCRGFNTRQCIWSNPTATRASQPICVETAAEFLASKRAWKIAFFWGKELLEASLLSPAHIDQDLGVFVAQRFTGEEVASWACHDHQPWQLQTCKGGNLWPQRMASAI